FICIYLHVLIDGASSRGARQSLAAILAEIGDLDAVVVSVVVDRGVNVTAIGALLILLGRADSVWITGVHIVLVEYLPTVMDVFHELGRDVGNNITEMSDTVLRCELQNQNQIRIRFIRGRKVALIMGLVFFPVSIRIRSFLHLSFQLTSIILLSIFR
ncbi:hypothetical protein PENTCL1PPCAC_2705, partial [Pristionchus entomophagus]